MFEQFPGTVHVVCAEHHIRPRRAPLHDVAILLGEASRHHDLAAVFEFLPRLEVAEVAVELVVGVLADAAGVDDDNVSLSLVGHRNETVGIEQPSDSLGVVFVHLAPVGAHDIGAGHGREGYRRCPASIRHGIDSPLGRVRVVGDLP